MGITRETVELFRYNSPYMLKIKDNKAYVYNRIYTFIGDTTDHRKADAHKLNDDMDLTVWLWTDVNQPWENKQFLKQYQSQLEMHQQMYEFIYEW